MSLLIATKNLIKLEDYKKVLAGFGVEAVSLADINDDDNVEETGQTLEENAILKAVYFAKKHSRPTIADDAGFEIDALGGEPGIYSRRWPGYAATDEELINMVVTKLAGVPLAERTAKFSNYLILADKDGNIAARGQGCIDGFIPEKICDQRWPHAPYRSCLFVPQFNKFWGKLSDAEFRELNFRYKAVEKILPEIKKLLS